MTNAITNNQNFRIAFTLRKKFETALLNDQNRAIFNKAFETFFRMTTKEARKLLWRLTFNDERYLSGNLQMLELTEENVPFDKVSLLRNELRYQYEQLYPGFLDCDVPDDCIDAFDALKKCTDDVTTNIVYFRCLNTSWLDDYSIKVILSRLNDTRETRIYQGISRIGFPHKASEYLMPYHQEIHDLLEALYKHNHPAICNFANQDSLVKDACDDLPFEFKEDKSSEPAEVPAEVSVEAPAVSPMESVFQDLTPEAILKNKDIFESYAKKENMNSLLGIGALGFDLNKVIVKKDAILKLLEAVEALNG